MVQWSRIRPLASGTESKLVPFFINGKRYHGLAGEPLIYGIFRTAEKKPQQLEALGLGSQLESALFCTKTKNGEEVCGSVWTLTVAENQSFKRLKKETSQENTPKNKRLQTNWLNRYWQSVVRSISAAKPQNELEEAQAAKTVQWQERTCDVVIIGGGQWGKLAYEALTATGVECLIVDKGPLWQTDLRGSHLEFCQATDVLPTGDILAVKRDGYQSLEHFKLKASAIIFATGATEFAQEFEGNDASATFSLKTVEALYQELGILPKGKAIVAIQSENEFTRAIHLKDAGLDLSLLVDARRQDQQKNRIRAMAHGIRMASLSVPHSFRQTKTGYELAVATSSDPEGKYAKLHQVELVISSAGKRPDAGLFLKSGGDFDVSTPDFPALCKPTRHPSGAWLVPLGSLVGMADADSFNSAEFAEELASLIANKRRRRTELFSAPCYDEENFGPADIALFGNGANLPDGFKEEKLKAELEANDPQSLFSAKLTSEESLSNWRLSDFDRFAGVYGYAMLQAMPIENKITLGSFVSSVSAKQPIEHIQRQINSRLVAFKAHPPYKSSGFINVAGLLHPERFEGDIMLLAINRAASQDIQELTLRPEKLSPSGSDKLQIYRLRDKRQARKMLKSIPEDQTLSLQEAAALALAQGELRFFQLFSETVFGLKRRKLGRYALTDQGAIPEIGDTLVANAHSKKAVAIVLYADRNVEGGLVVYPLGSNLPAGLYHPGINKDYTHF